ncbi:hypothetical protein B0F86_17770 [Pseudomonas syringae]|nr:hypothetical protein B0F86_17770 [Pseudomonas syringae]
MFSDYTIIGRSQVALQAGQFDAWELEPDKCQGLIELLVQIFEARQIIRSEALLLLLPIIMGGLQLTDPIPIHAFNLHFRRVNIVTIIHGDAPLFDIKFKSNKSQH